MSDFEQDKSNFKKKINKDLRIMAKKGKNGIYC